MKSTMSDNTPGEKKRKQKPPTPTQQAQYYSNRSSKRFEAKLDEAAVKEFKLQNKEYYRVYRYNRRNPDDPILSVPPFPNMERIRAELREMLQSSSASPKRQTGTHHAAATAVASPPVEPYKVILANLMKDTVVDHQLNRKKQREEEVAAHKDVVESSKRVAESSKRLCARGDAMDLAQLEELRELSQHLKDEVEEDNHGRDECKKPRARTRVEFEYENDSPNSPERKSRAHARAGNFTPTPKKASAKKAPPAKKTPPSAKQAPPSSAKKQSKAELNKEKLRKMNNKWASENSK